MFIDFNVRVRFSKKPNRATIKYVTKCIADMLDGKPLCFAPDIEHHFVTRRQKRTQRPQGVITRPAPYHLSDGNIP